MRASARGPVEAGTRAEVVDVALALAVDEGQHDRIQLVDPADVVHVRIDLVAQAEVQRSCGRTRQSSCTNPAMCTLSALGITRFWIRPAAAQRDREQQVVVVDPPVAVAIEARESPRPARRGRRGTRRDRTRASMRCTCAAESASCARRAPASSVSDDLETPLQRRPAARGKTSRLKCSGTSTERRAATGVIALSKSL